MTSVKRGERISSQPPLRFQYESPHRKSRRPVLCSEMVRLCFVLKKASRLETCQLSAWWRSLMRIMEVLRVRIDMHQKWDSEV
jgi:hypothetical protein